MTREEAAAAYESAAQSADCDMGRASRKIAERQIACGALQGYLAYADGKSIGWCNANDLVNYPIDACNGERFHLSKEKREKGRVKIAACFEIAPEYRMQGVATTLLTRVCEDAKRQGYIAVEGFPCVRAERYEWDNYGPIRLYEKLGFLKMAEENGYLAMRKPLK